VLLAARARPAEHCPPGRRRHPRALGPPARPSSGGGRRAAVPCRRPGCRRASRAELACGAATSKHSMGFSVRGSTASTEDAEKASFQQCAVTNCAKLAEKYVGLRSATDVAAKFGQVVGQRPNDSVRYGAMTSGDKVGLEKDSAASELLECEKRCARRHWPSAETKPWIGEVVLQIVNTAPDMHKEQGKLGRFF
ncbi:unnamed protein product, partial [Prorocentrum cordatum]